MSRWSPTGAVSPIERAERAADARTRALTRTLALLSVVPGVLSLARSGLHDPSADLTLGLIALFTVAYVALYVAVPWPRLPRDLFALHILAGAAFVGVIVARTGGAASPFIFNFFLTVVMAALYFRLALALLLTALTGALSLALTWSPGNVFGLSAQSVSRAAILFCVAVIVNRTAEQMRRLERRRRESEADFAALRHESLQLRRRTTELDTLHRVATADGLDTTALLDTAARGARQTLGVARVAVMLYDATTGDGDVAALVSDDAPETTPEARVAMRGTDLERLLQAGEPVVTDDIASDPRMAALRPVCDAGAALFAPLVCDAAPLGAIIMGAADDDHTFTDDEARFAATLASTLVVTLMRMRTRREERRANGYVDSLNAVVAAAAACADPADLGRRAIAALATALDMDGGSLYVLDRDGLRLRLAAGREARDATARFDDVIPLAAPRLVAEAARTNRPAFSGDNVSLPAEAAGYLRRYNARGYAVVPLPARGRVVGVLSLLGRDARAITRDERELLCAAAATLALALDNGQLQASAARTTVESIEALAGAIEARDGYTGEHCARMAARAVALAEALGLSAEEVATVRLGAVLHDVGKIGVPDAVLNKPARLDAEEFAVMKRHPEIGAGIVGAVARLRAVVPLVRHHHERFDGGGYPDGLSGEEIPIGARILTVVDTYGAMTEDRIYRTTPGHARAVIELERGAGAQFDPHVARTFLRLLQTPRTDAQGSSALPPPLVVAARAIEARPASALHQTDRHARMGDLVARDLLLAPVTPTEEALALFEREPERAAVTLGADGIADALVTRQGLLTKLSGLYGNAIYRKRPVARVARTAMLAVDAGLSPAEVARRATGRPAESRYDPVVVTEGGRYIGCVAVFQLLDHLNDEALRRARLSNPLSGLPGAPLLDTELGARVAAGAPTAFVLADIDGFKAYNDHYGLARGDEMLLMAANLLRDVASEVEPDTFLGHVGGDDFVLLARPDCVAVMRARITARTPRRVASPPTTVAAGAASTPSRA